MQEQVLLAGRESYKLVYEFSSEKNPLVNRWELCQRMFGAASLVFGG